MEEANIVKVKIKIIVNICMLNTYFNTKAQLSGWRRSQIGTLEDIKQSCKLEVKGMLGLALCSGIENPPVANLSMWAMFQ